MNHKQCLNVIFCFLLGFLLCILCFAASSIQLRRDDVQAPQNRRHVGDLVAFDQLRENRKVDERRRPRAGAERLPAPSATT